MISVTKSQKNALWITHSFLRQLRLIQRSRILRASGSRVLRASSSKAVSPIAPHRHAGDHTIGEPCRWAIRTSQSSLRALRSPFYYSHLSPPHARLSGRRQVERAGCMEKARMDREFCARIERAFKTGDENRQAAATTHGTISTRPR